MHTPPGTDRQMGARTHTNKQILNCFGQSDGEARCLPVAVANMIY